jgi:hypothetical protein
MSTHAAFFVETGEGVVGTYVHYDGYPSHMLHPLMRLTPHEVNYHIVVAAPRGGYRIFDEDPIKREMVEGAWLGGAEVYTDTDDVPAYCHHIYLKHQDGSVSHREHGDIEWQETCKL